MHLGASVMKTTSGCFKVEVQDKKNVFNYYRKLSANYEGYAGAGFYHFFRQRERRAVLEFLDLEPAARFLDVGCGGGFYALSAKQAGMHVTATDIVPEFTERLRDKVDEVVQSDIEQLSLKGQFDRIVCAGVLDFVVDPEGALRKLAGLLVEGGKLVVLLPRQGWGGELYRFEKWIFGIRINLFSQEWFDSMTASMNLIHEGRRNPLPNSMVLSYTKMPDRAWRSG